MKIEGQFKADELRVGRIIIDNLKEPAEFSALAGFISTKDAQTLGWTKATGQWSDETRELAVKLRESMESDIHRALFEGSSTDTATPGKGLKLSGGLGEHLQGDLDAPSV